MKNTSPYRKTKITGLVSWFIRSFVDDRFQEEILGDLYEYGELLKSKNSGYPSFLILWQGLQFMRLYALKTPFKNSKYRIMIQMNFKVAYRHMQRNRFFSLLNIIGLSLGLAVSMLLGLYVKDELSYDKHWKNADRIYRIVADLRFDGNEHVLSTSPAPMAAAYKDEFPEISKSARFRTVGTELIKVDNKKHMIPEVAFGDQEILEIFQLDFISGNASKAIGKPGEAIIDASTSKQLYGTLESVGNTFYTDDGKKFQITGVYEDIPVNSHFHFNLIASMESGPNSMQGIWLSNNYRTYILLHEDASYQELENKFSSTYEKYLGPQLKQMANVDWEDFEKSDSYVNYTLQPLASIHLHSNRSYEIEANGNITYVIILGMAGLITLIIAAINFMNIATAQSSLRAKEVGMRKVLGGVRRQLIGQFLTEAILYALIGMVFAAILCFIALPYFETMSGKSINNPFFGRIGIWKETLLITFVIGLLSGIYPAFFLSLFKPLNVLKGNLKLGSRKNGLRNGLVILQFVASTLLLFGSFAIFSQLNYYQSKSLGFDKEQLLIIRNTHTLGEKTSSFKEELLENSLIEHATFSSYLPISYANRSDAPFLRGESSAENGGSVSLQIWYTDEDYINTLGMNLAKGRNFDRALASDSNSVILNQRAVERFGYENPIGKTIKILGTYDVRGMTEFKIVGIVDDFHFDNFKSSISPLALMYVPTRSTLTVKYPDNKASEVLQLVGSKWEEFNASQKLEYNFLDDQFDQYFRSERKLGSLFTVFTVLSIIIACLGLIGLASFTLDQKRKEIGVRKVLGASVRDLIVQQLKGYTTLIGTSLMIGIPIGHIVINQWLEDFNYRADLGFYNYLLPILIVLGLSWGLISFISMRYAKQNPVMNLRDE